MTDGVMPIYLAGRAHSGSTFLDVLLNGHRDIKGCGGIVDAINRGPDELCSCGTRIRECPAWAEVFAAYRSIRGRSLDDDKQLLFDGTDIRRFGSALRSNPGDPSDPWHDYAAATRALSAAIGRSFGVRAYVDSNKEYTRALMMLKDPTALPALVVAPTHLPNQWLRELNTVWPDLKGHLATEFSFADAPIDLKFCASVVAESLKRHATASQ